MKQCLSNYLTHFAIANSSAGLTRTLIISQFANPYRLVQHYKVTTQNLDTLLNYTPRNNESVMQYKALSRILPVKLCSFIDKDFQLTSNNPLILQFTIAYNI